MTTFAPSPQQRAFFDWVVQGSGSCILEAVAGAGKTTTIIEALHLMSGDVFVGAYNKKIADELKARIEALGMGSRVRASTLHAAGFSAWRFGHKSVQVDGNKTLVVLDEMAHRRPRQAPYKGFAARLVSLAKQSGIGFLTPETDDRGWYDLVAHHGLDFDLAEDMLVEEGLEIARGALSRSIERAGDIIDFDDMIYMPLVGGSKMWGQDWVILDEAQDTNATRRALSRKMLKASGRMIAVGDPHQAIYGFTGADSDSLNLIAQQFDAVRLPLTITYRCPKRVVIEARKYVQHIKAGDTAPEGTVTKATFEDLVARKPGVESVVLCRYNAPLAQAAYALLRAGIACQIEGRDFANGLVKLCRKWKRVTTLAALNKRLAEYLEVETAKWLAKGKEQVAAALSDRVSAIRILSERLQTQENKQNVDDLVEFIQGLFGDVKEGERPRVLTLSTVHKAKGREWETVYIQDMTRHMPSKWAKREWEKAQEVNLMYVAVTRTKQNLVYLETGFGE